jgi:hypothetical protein
MEETKNLECSLEELPGVEGVERSEGDDGNWGGPPRPGGLCVPPEDVRRPITGEAGKWATRREGVGGGRSTA